MSIFFAVGLNALIASLCDYGKEQQFLKLEKNILNEKCTVIRGQYGTSQEILVSDLVVGDLLCLNQGDKVPADCILVEEADMRLDERFYFAHPETSDADVCKGKDDDKYQQKQCSDGKNHEENPDTFVLQDTLMITGSGRAIVLCVGDRTLKIKEIFEDQYISDDAETPLQKKLRLFSELLGSWSWLAAAVAFSLYTIFFLINIMASQSVDLISTTTLLSLVYNIQIAVVLLIVSIPEGMPLAISMALAFSIDRLKKDNLLIKKMEALETSGSLLDICTGKTSTLTTGHLVVRKLHIGQCFQDVARPEINLELFHNMADLIAMNTNARMEMNDEDAKYVPQGDIIEVALLNFLIDNGYAVQDLMVKRER